MGEKTTIDRNVIDKTTGSGLFQIRTIFLLCLVSCIGGSVVLCSIFLLYTPPHRCTVPEVDWINGTPPATIFTVSSNTALWNASNGNATVMLRRFVPVETSFDGGTRWSQCSRYNESAIWEDLGNISFSNQSLTGCNEGWTYYVQPGEVSATMEFALVCDKSWLNPLPVTMQLFGFMVGSVVGGYLSDRYGRKTTLLLSIIINTTATCGLAWTSIAAGLNICMFLMGVASIMRSSGNVIIVNESTPTKRRNVAATLVVFCSSLGNLILPLVAYVLPNWRWMMTTSAIASAAVIPTTVCFIEETVTWLTQARKFNKAEKVIKTVSRLNGVETEFQVPFVPASDHTVKPDPEQTSYKQKRHYSYIDMAKVSFLRHRLMKLGMALYDIAWALLFRGQKTGLSNTAKLSVSTLFFFALFTYSHESWAIAERMLISSAYFGLSLNSNRLGGSKYLNATYAALVEICSYGAAQLMLRKCSYRQLVVFCTGMCGLCLFVAPLAKSVGPTGEIICSMAGKFFITISFVIICIFTGDFFPTLLRHQAYGAASFSGRIGGVITPYILYLGDIVHVAIPYILMGSFTCIAAFAVFLLPEVKGMDLPQTMDDARDQERFAPRIFCRKPKTDANDNFQS